MNIKRTFVIAGATVALFLIGDAPRQAQAPLGLQLVSEAHAIFGVRRRTARRWAVVGYSAGAASAHAADSQADDQADDQQQSAASQQAEPEAAAPAATAKPLPVGTVAQSLPPDCKPTPVGEVQYYYCGGNFYRAVLQGNKLVYVTTHPK